MNLRQRVVRCAVLLAASAFAIAAPNAPGAPARHDALKDAVYTSPTWGYTIRWRSNEWSVERDASIDGADVLELGDGVGNRVEFVGRPSGGESPADCLDRMIAETTAVTGTTGYSVVHATSGEPFSGRSDYQAYLVYRLKQPDAEGAADERIVYSECQALAPDAAVFERQYTGSQEAFGAWYGAIVEMVESVQLPASAWVPVDPAANDGIVWAGLAPLRGSWRINAAFVAEPGGTGTVLVGLVDEAESTRVVAFENAGGESLSVDPNGVALRLVSLNALRPPETIPLKSVDWERRRNGRAGSAVVLSPGERATARLEFAPTAPDAIACGDLPLLVLSYLGVDFAESDPSGELADCVTSP